MNYLIKFLRNKINDGDLALHTGRNVLIKGNYVYKCYDYRSISNKSHVEESIRRSSLVYAFSDLLEITEIVNWQSPNNALDSLKIIRYIKVPGIHIPSKIGHFIILLDKIKTLHSQDIVHGDIRFHNVIFSGKDDVNVISILIDFDYSGIVGDRVYPNNFNLDIPDGYRHPDVKGGELLQKSHDLESLKWLCSQYVPIKNDLKQLWESALQNFDITDFLSIFNSSFNENINTNNSVTVNSVNKGTGSPPMKTKYDNLN